MEKFPRGKFPGERFFNIAAPSWGVKGFGEGILE
jgi:hypothetical protein